MRRFNKAMRLIKQFGFAFTIQLYFHKLLGNNDKYIELCCNYLFAFTRPLISKYNTITNTELTNEREIIKKIPVWVCWWQGEEHMPELCRICYKRLDYMLPDNAQLQFVTMENYQQYVDIPEYIIEQFNKKMISYTQLSDILRWMLLGKYGGMWIDSTVFCIKPIDSDLLKKPDFWSVKLPEVQKKENIGQLVSQCRWSGFILKSNNPSVLVKFVQEATLYYWKEHSIIIDYFLQNMLIKIAYENIASVKTDIDKIPLSNFNLYTLHDIMSEKFDSKILDKVRENTTFYKLTYKKGYKKYTGDKETFFKKLKDGEF